MISKFHNMFAFQQILLTNSETSSQKSNKQLKCCTYGGTNELMCAQKLSEVL